MTELEKVRGMAGKGKLEGKDAIGVRAGKVVNKYKVAKHFELTIDDDSFDYSVNEKSVAEEAALETTEDDEPESFDLIWSEGALYNIGIAEALRLYHPVVKPGGYFAFTEAVWRKDDPPEEVKAAFEDYSGMGSARDVLAKIEASDFSAEASRLRLRPGAQVIQVFLKHDGAILLALIERLQNFGGLEHAQGLGGGWPGAIEQVDDPVYGQDGVLRQQIEEANADHRGVVAGYEAGSTLSDDGVQPPRSGDSLFGHDCDACEEVREPTLPIAIGPHCGEPPVILLAVELEEEAQVEKRPR